MRNRAGIIVLMSASALILAASPAVAKGYDNGTVACAPNYTDNVHSRSTFQTNVWPPQTPYRYYYSYTWATRDTLADAPGKSGTWFVDAYNDQGQVDAVVTNATCVRTGG